MAFDEKLAERVRTHIGKRAGVSQKTMFGGIAFLLHGNMSCGVRGHELIVRIDPQTTETALAEPGTRIFDVGGRRMKGWLLVGGAGIRDDPALARWIRRGLAYAASLPEKPSR